MHLCKWITTVTALEPYWKVLYSNIQVDWFTNRHWWSNNDLHILWHIINYIKLFTHIMMFSHARDSGREAYQCERGLLPVKVYPLGASWNRKNWHQTGNCRPLQLCGATVGCCGHTHSFWKELEFCFWCLATHKFSHYLDLVCSFI